MKTNQKIIKSLNTKSASRKSQRLEREKRGGLLTELDQQRKRSQDN